MVASPEDMVIYKTVSGIVRPERPHDRPDVDAVFRRKGTHLDRAYLRKWAKFFEEQGVQGVTARIEELIEKSGES